MNIGAETEWIEFKKTTGELKEGIVSLASMLNKNGYGSLYFGVRDNGDVLGQQIGDRTLREISQAKKVYDMMDQETEKRKKKTECKV